MGQFLSSRLDKSVGFGNFALILFIILQVLDGVFTYRGLSLGLAGEGNPLVRMMISFLGLGAGLAVAKVIGVGLGIILYQRRAYIAIAVLDAIYVIFGIVPWIFVLFGYY